MAAGKKRQANFELLRMTAMLMVVAMHFLSHTGGLPEAGQMPGARGTAAVLAESFCIVAVNVYVLISGYFLSESGFSLKRLLRLLLQVLFYTLLIPPVLVLAGVLPAGEAFQIYHIWQCLFPVEAGALLVCDCLCGHVSVFPGAECGGGGHDAEAAADYAHGTADLFQSWEKREHPFIFHRTGTATISAGSFSFI